ncbi:MAG: phage portal protein [Pseudonocardiaceae bacterium]
MPLPVANSPWPPPGHERAQQIYRECWAWYSGDSNLLAALYQGGSGYPGYQGPAVRPSQYSGGLRGMVARLFWGLPPTAGQRQSKLHIPVAGDIATASADLLFGEPVTLTVSDKATQARLDEIMTSAGVRASLREGAELAAALGGVYLRAGLDIARAEHPIVDAVPADTAVPEWAGRTLAAVTFWRILDVEAGRWGTTAIWRHLERHEPGGRVYHGLYQGTETSLGRPMPLSERPDTAYLADQVDQLGGISLGTEGLGVVYLPNAYPNKVLRGSSLGRSDYTPAVIGMMDALDEMWSSWLRDIRTGKSMLLVPDSYLKSNGPGKGAQFDPEQEIFRGMNMIDHPDSTRDMITQVQFSIRVEEHERSTAALFKQICRSAGYSPSTFGEHEEGGVATATEVDARKDQSNVTREKKIDYATPALAQLARILLDIDRTRFGTTVTPQRPTVEFPDRVTPDPEQLARTLQLLDAARAISTRIKVRMLHPDWDDKDIEAEVALIEKETAPPPVVDPVAGLRAAARTDDE